MEGTVGDRLIVRGRRVGQGAPEGEIVEVMPGPGGIHFRVRWSDGHESILYPGSDVIIEKADEVGTTTRHVKVEVRVHEDADHCTATAAMITMSGSFRGMGQARRRPGDPEVPMIGEELAIARALADLSDSLEQAAANALSVKEDRPVHLL